MTREAQDAAFDIRSVLAQSGGDQDQYRDDLEAFLRGLSLQLQRLRDACQQADAAKLSSVILSLRGSAAQIGAGATYRIAMQMDDLARAGATAHAIALLPALESCLGALQKSIESALEPDLHRNATPPGQSLAFDPLKSVESSLPGHVCGSITCQGHPVAGMQCPSGWYQCAEPNCPGRHSSYMDSQSNACAPGQYKCEMMGCRGHRTPSGRCQGLFL